MSASITYENILTRSENNIFYISINREAKLNALNIQTLKEIRLAVESVQNNDEIKGIILTGSGPKAFAAGADIAEFANFNVEQGTEMSRAGHEVMNSIENSVKPVIACVNGFALGGGCELAMACHMRVASENAKFGQPEVNLGIIPGYAGTQRLLQLVGKGKAIELLLTGDAISAADALTFGLVNYVTSAENLIPKAVEILEKIKGKSPRAIAKTLVCVNDYFSHDMNGFQTEIREFGQCFASEDFKEGTTAFLEKRKAAFTGK